ncbi:MAG TPA: hypothetical protein VND65_16110 [Candidatus Binatia bacterium]|nr:hypothetical protein [Candidatus Binatia bacterium]
MRQPQTKDSYHGTLNPAFKPEWPGTATYDYAGDFGRFSEA